VKDVFLWVILPLILAEAVLVGPWLAERLLRWGAHGLPEEYREQYTADWLGELDAVPGSIFKLAFAVRVLVRVPATERALTGRDELWVLAVKQLLTLAITGLAALSVVLQALVHRVGSARAKAQHDAMLRRFVEETKVRAAAEVGARVNIKTRMMLDSPLRDSSLPPRTVTSLHRAGIKTYGDLLDKYGEKGEKGMLGTIRNFGRTDMQAVDRLISEDLVIDSLRTRRDH
jgi:hypothetical protein